MPQVEALEARIQPYRPEDADDVEAMYLRAKQAQESQDIRWMAIPVLPPRSLMEEFDAFFVAEKEETDTINVVGIIGVQTFRADEAIPGSHPLAQEWQSRGDVVELRRLRVAPETRGQGIGARLCHKVIEWSRTQGYRTLVVNTTTPQLPALQLYRKLGFHDAGISFIDRYELIWLELSL